jgi:alpha-D-ribose 1-methylphosphonate 5-triphosphate synthase subunit PhnH
VFRALMRAMAEPGRIETLPRRPRPPAPLAPAADALVRALCDGDVSLWLSPAVARPEAADHLRFHSEARIVAAAHEAAFAVIDAGELDIAAFPAGTPAYPDRGATVIVQCGSLSGGPELALSGPGIAAIAPFAVQGLPADFPAQAMANRGRFPCGIDLIFVEGDRFLALPRSARIIPERR